MKNPILLLFILLFFAGAVISERLIAADQWYKVHFEKTQTKVDKNFYGLELIGQFFGLRNICADLMWIDAMQYMGNAVNAKENYKKFNPMVKSICRLAPNFVYAYQNGSAVLMWYLHDYDNAIEFLKEGITNNPERGTLKLYLVAITYYKTEKYAQTIDFLEKLVAGPEEHPPMLEQILGNLYVKVNMMEKAKALWWWMWYHSKDAECKKYAKNHLEKFGYWYQ